MKMYKKDLDAIARLSPEQFRVTQQRATEFPGTGEHLDNKEPGIYANCRNDVSPDTQIACAWHGHADTRPIPSSNRFATTLVV